MLEKTVHMRDGEKMSEKGPPAIQAISSNDIETKDTSPSDAGTPQSEDGKPEKERQGSMKDYFVSMHRIWSMSSTDIQKARLQIY